MFEHSEGKIELLKKQVLINADIFTVMEADMEALTDKIRQVTRKELSPISLCKLYGFKETKFKPSLHTLNVLSNFCGYESWKKFCELT